MPETRKQKKKNLQNLVHRHRNQSPTTTEKHLQTAQTRQSIRHLKRQRKVKKPRKWMTEPRGQMVAKTRRKKSLPKFLPKFARRQWSQSSTATGKHRPPIALRERASAVPTPVARHAVVRPILSSCVAAFDISSVVPSVHTGGPIFPPKKSGTKPPWYKRLWKCTPPQYLLPPRIR